MKRALPILALIAAVLVGGGVLTAQANNVQTAVPVPSCVKPSTNITNQKMVNFNECRFNRIEALLANHAAVTPTPAPSPSATPTPTPSPSVSATPTPSPTPTPA